MVKRFLNKRNVLYNTKKNAFLHSGWRERGSVKRLHRNDLRQHLYNGMTKKSGKKVSQLTRKELEDIDKMVNGMVDEEMKHYEMFEKANSIEKPKRIKKGKNVTMKNVPQYGEEFATSANVERQQKYIEAHPELMTEKELKQYKEKKHRMKMNEVMNLASKLRIRATNQAIEEADAVFLSAAASATGKPLSPSKMEARTLKNLEFKDPFKYRYSKSKKRIMKTNNYLKYARKHKPNHSSHPENKRSAKRVKTEKKTTIHMKNVKKALPSPGPSAAAASVPPVSPQNSNNNNYKNNSNSNSNSNSNRNEFRMRNWQK
jgi:hypothetical protein